MDIKRRQFLKIAGLSTIAGLGAPAAFNLLLKGQTSPVSLASSSAESEAAHEAAPTGVRLGMVIDQRVFDANRGLAQRCVTACHTVHNVPQFDNPNTWRTPVFWCSATTATTHHAYAPVRQRLPLNAKTVLLPWITTDALAAVSAWQRVHTA